MTPATATSHANHHHQASSTSPITQPTATATSPTTATTLQFVPFQSELSVEFWLKFSKYKLEILRLGTVPIPVIGAFDNAKLNANLVERQKIALQLDNFSLTNAFSSIEILLKIQEISKTSNTLESCYRFFSQQEIKSELNLTLPSTHQCLYFGKIHHYNTLRDFRECDSAALIKEYKKELLTAIDSKTIFTTGSILNSFALLSYLDLKSYRMYYWFCFPALIDPAYTFQSVGTPMHIHEAFSTEQYEHLHNQWPVFRQQHPVGIPPFFLIEMHPEHTEFHLFESWPSLYSKSLYEIIICFSDPSTLLHPGWSLRNLLLCIARNLSTFPVTLRFLSFRDDTFSSSSIAMNSLIWTVTVTSSTGEPSGLDSVRVVGWERNGADQIAPRQVSISLPALNPLQVMEDSVDLNLKLMQWRALPSINLSTISSAKCLLIGAGTLGCNVARNLLSWGIRHISFVDYGTVKYNNPVRQSLFTYSDGIQSVGKAEAAAKHMQDILPSVVSAGYNFTVPMPGHPIHATEATKYNEALKTLESLISEHDMIFLLTDSRESRWLPTVICSSKNKLCINAALGFDSYLVMRHGGLSAHSPHTENERFQLSCYFCGDVIAPTNTTSDRTLDQQCTVTRPGISMLASAYAAELAVAAWQHKDKIFADVIQKDNDSTMNGLGYLPHQVRGFLQHFSTSLLVGKASEYCTACSPIIQNTYKHDGDEFLMRAFNSPTSYLEQLTGWHKLRNNLELKLANLDFLDEDINDGDDDDADSDELAS